jgi:hypothetical protein
VDFFNRLYVASDTAADNAGINDTMLTLPDTEARLTSAMQQWLAQNTEPTDPNQVATSQPQKPPLMADGTDLGSLLVKVQAVFISRENGKYIALVTMQDKENRGVEYIRLVPGQRIADYQVTTIDPLGVVFSADGQPTAEQSSVRVNVFEKTSEISGNHNE